MSFFASRVQVQKIQKGTEDFIRGALDDLGIEDVRVKSWRLEHFLTDYRSEEPDSDDWRAVWLDTWEIAVEMTGKPAAVHPEAVVGTRSYDDSWSGDFDTELPATLVVFLDFPRPDAATNCERLVSDFSTNRWEDDAGNVKAGVRKMVQDAFVPKGTTPAATIRPGQTCQLVVDCGKHSAKEIEARPPRPTAIRELGLSFGATSNWRGRPR
ncbi:MAG: hypothetical protein AB7T37_00840 [Dehalococcoidia bacterium]